MASNLKELVELSVEFKNAVEAGLGKDSAMQQRVLASLKPGEMERIQDQMMEVVTQELAVALGGEPTDEFLKLNLAVVETVADLGLRAAPVAELAKYVPAGLKTDEKVAELQALNAPNLASICAFK